MKIRFENVARPPDADTETVPPMPVGLEVMLTEAVDVVATLPYTSCTCTTAVNAVPAVPVAGGCVETTSFAGAAAPIAMAVLVTGDSEPEVAVSVYVPAVVKTRFVKVATPFPAATVVVPLTPAAVDAMVTEAVEFVTRFPPASSTRTDKPNAVPAVPVDGGWAANDNFAGAVRMLAVVVAEVEDSVYLAASAPPSVMPVAVTVIPAPTAELANVAAAAALVTVSPDATPASEQDVMVAVVVPS